MKNPTGDAPALMGRRSFLAAAAAVTASATALARDFRPGAPPIRYPDPDVIVLDKRFSKYKIFNAGIERLYTGLRWAEGPAWCAAGMYFVCSDIPNNRQVRRLEEDGHVSTFRTNCGYSNGNTFDYEGRQLSCQHLNRRIVRYEHDGGMKVLADKYEGKRLNAPNDIVVHPDGGVWFTDPGYGALVEYEGHKAPLEIKEATYRIDPHTGKLEKVEDTLFKPNGLCFSPDYKKLYIVDTGVTHYEKAPRNIMVFDVVDGKKLTNGREYISMVWGEKKGIADGIRADIDGNIWVGSGWAGEGYDGVQVFAPDGTRIGLIQLPEICSNVCFGGKKRNRLFMTASQSIYSLYLETRGAHIC